MHSDLVDSPQILIVDDEALVRRTFARALGESGYRVVECQDGLEAIGRLRLEQPSLIILDVQMPRLDGWKALAEIRRRGSTQPVLMITHTDDVDSRVRGLELGADDYLGKPCTAPELLARVRALLRRAQPRPERRSTPLRFGNITVDIEAKTADQDGMPLRLSRTDYAVLALLRENLGRPVSRDELVERVWDNALGGSHALDTHIWRLRRKLGDTGEHPRWILNISGVGYQMAATLGRDDS